MINEDGVEMKYSGNQRNVESLSKRNQRILRTEKKKHNIIL